MTLTLWKSPWQMKDIGSSGATAVKSDPMRSFCISSIFPKASSNNNPEDETSFVTCIPAENKVMYSEVLSGAIMRRQYHQIMDCNSGYNSWKIIETGSTDIRGNHDTTDQTMISPCELSADDKKNINKISKHINHPCCEYLGLEKTYSPMKIRHECAEATTAEHTFADSAEDIRDSELRSVLSYDQGTRQATVLPSETLCALKVT